MKTKRFLSVLLALVLVLALLPVFSVPVRAEGGSCGENLTWSFSDGVLNISGTGNMTNYSSYTDVPWYEFCSSITSVVIANGVTSIGNETFSGCTSLLSVNLPASVTSIGSSAFERCSALASITIPYGVTRIEYNTFAKCTSLASITIPASVELIGKYAFCWTALTNVTIPRGVTRINEGAFSSCSLLTSITIPESVTLIEAGVCSTTPLTDVYYFGSEVQWKSIVFGEFNDNLKNATIHYDFVLPGQEIPVDSTHFPDAAFRVYVSNAFDQNSDGKLTSLELAAVTEIDVRNKGIASLKGIEHFTNLIALYCDDNQLSSLDVSKNTALESLLCCGNPLTSLNVTKNTTLTVLDVRDCRLTALDVTKNTVLENLYCQNNQLRALNITKNPLLRNLWCYGNSISLLSISENNRLLDAYLNGDDTVYDDDGTYQAYELEEENNYYLYVDVDTVVSTSPVAAPSITTQPKAKTVAAGAKATFKVVASGEGLSYQWQYKTSGSSTWKNKAGATKASYTVTAKESYNGMQYRCIVSNTSGKVTSSSAKLTVTAAVAAPTITTQPKAQTAAVGATATFKVVASGEGLTYQWQYKTSGSSTWKDKSGATKASYTVTAKESYNGIQYRCKVSNAGGSVTSTAATLTVTLPKPEITTQPKAQTAAAGETATFKVVASGTGLTYQWQ
ncbi:MAG: leucine-rich repeat protein, partial [Oscillospiraceae bacterium]|nr:leucine-rich repeat protein [Oscillospiraceae bacterium]